MASLDYCSCDNCGKGKVFYDANVDWEAFRERLGSIRVICAECFKGGVRLQITNTRNKFNEVHNWGIHCWTEELSPEQSEGKGG